MPPAGAGLLTHCMLAYHLPLLIAFSIRCELSRRGSAGRQPHHQCQTSDSAVGAQVLEFDHSIKVSLPCIT